MKKLIMVLFGTLCFVPCARATDKKVTYLAYENGSFVEREATCTVLTSDITTLNHGGWYVVDANLTIDHRIEVYGGTSTSTSANLVLMDGNTLTIEGGIRVKNVTHDEVRNALAIYGQRAGTGTLVANGALECAGIGSDSGCPSGTVTITGGTVVATGGKGGGAGIGSGHLGSPSGAVTINGGTVTANGTDGGSGIGHGLSGSGDYVTINGGTVTANGMGGSKDCGCYGIGCSTGKTIINGGTVRALRQRTNAVTENSIQYQPLNGDGEAVYLVTVTLPKGTSATDPVTISGLAGYGTQDIRPSAENKLYLYLPNGDYTFVVNGMQYVATVDGEATVARACVVRIGERKYVTLDEAIAAAAENDVVEILADIDDVDVTVDRKITIAGGDFTLTGKAQTRAVKVVAGGVLTVSGGNYQTNSLTKAGTSQALFAVDNGGRLTVAAGGVAGAILLEGSSDASRIEITDGVIDGEILRKDGTAKGTILIPGTSTATFDRDQSAWCAEGYRTEPNDQTPPRYAVVKVPTAVTVSVSVGEGVEKVVYGGQEHAEDFSIPDVAPGTALTFTMVTAGDEYDEVVTAEGDVTGGKVGNDYVYTVASALTDPNAAIRFNTTVVPAVAYVLKTRTFVARCSTFAEAWAYASDGVHYVKIFKDYTGSESSEQFALDGTMCVNFNGHTVYATAERGKGFAIETENSRHKTYTPYDTIAEAYAMGGSQSTYVVLGTADASTITLRPGNLGFEGHFWEGDDGIVGSIVNEPKLKNAEKTQEWGVSDMTFEFVAKTDKPTPLMPGQGSKPYETRDAAEAAAAETEVLPAEEFDLLGHPDALATWQGYFVNQVYAGGDGKFRIMPELNADGSNALAQAEARLTRALNVGAIAAATEAIGEMVLEGAEPGFYYTLFKSTDVTTVLEQENHDPDNCDCKAQSDGKVTFENVTKPSAATGFFSVRAFVKESFTNPFGGGGFGGFGE